MGCFSCCGGKHYQPLSTDSQYEEPIVSAQEVEVNGLEAHLSNLSKERHKVQDYLLKFFELFDEDIHNVLKMELVLQFKVLYDVLAFFIKRYNEMERDFNLINKVLARLEIELDEATDKYEQEKKKKERLREEVEKLKVKLKSEKGSRKNSIDSRVNSEAKKASGENNRVTKTEEKKARERTLVDIEIVEDEIHKSVLRGAEEEQISDDPQVADMNQKEDEEDSPNRPAEDDGKERRGHKKHHRHHHKRHRKHKRKSIGTLLEDVGKNELSKLKSPKKKKCLVLDIDYTLYDYKGPPERVDEYSRPYLHEFLRVLSLSYDIVIWSATDLDIIIGKLNSIGVLNKPEYNIIGLMCRKFMIPVFVEKEGQEKKKYLVKPLQVLWNKYLCFSPENTIHIDDLDHNFYLNYQNGLRIEPYNEAPIMQDDRELYYLTKYLLLVSDLDNFSSLNHSRWKEYTMSYLWTHQDRFVLPLLKHEAAPLAPSSSQKQIVVVDSEEDRQIADDLKKANHEAARRVAEEIGHSHGEANTVPEEPSPDEPSSDEPSPDEPSPDEASPDEPSPDEPSPDEPSSDLHADEAVVLKNPVDFNSTQKKDDNKTTQVEDFLPRSGEDRRQERSENKENIQIIEKNENTQKRKRSEGSSRKAYDVKQSNQKREYDREKKEEIVVDWEEIEG